MIKNLTRGRIHKTSLFIQPEYKCNIGCKGCYAVKNIDLTHELAEELMHIGEGVHNDTIKFEQVTVSLNDLNQPDAEYSAAIAENTLEDFGKEITHYACSINSLLMYNKLMSLEQCGALNISIDVDKLAKMSEKEQQMAGLALADIKKENKDLYININLLARERKEKYSKEVTDTELLILSSADSVHLIMDKPISNLFNIEYLENFKNSFEIYVRAVLEIKKHTLETNTTVDACVMTVLSNLIDDTIFTCRAGTDHASLWPDGKFTGCAYRMSDTEFAIGDGATIKFDDYDKVQDIKVAEFNLCLYNKLSELYGSFDELCKNLKLDKKEITLLKSVVK